MAIYQGSVSIGGGGGKSPYEYAEDAGFVGTEEEFYAASSQLPEHIGDINNPHQVTAEQVGARPADWMPTAADVGAARCATYWIDAGKAISFDFQDGETYALITCRGWAGVAECAFLFSGYASSTNQATMKIVPLSGNSGPSGYISYGTNKVGHGFTVQNNSDVAVSVNIARFLGTDEIIVEETAENAYSLNNYTAIPISAGGTGATGAATARANLGITLENIGAAPAGFGLGTYGKTLTSSDDLNTIKLNGVYEWAWNDMPTNAPTIPGFPLAGYSAVMRVSSANGSRLIQNIYYPQLATDAVGWVWIELRRTYDSTNGWQAAEFYNPPLASGYEYRTTERINGKAVYKRNNGGVIEYRLEGETEWKPYAQAVGGLATDGSNTMTGNLTVAPSSNASVDLINGAAPYFSQFANGYYTAYLRSFADKANKGTYRSLGLRNIGYTGNIGKALVLEEYENDAKKSEYDILHTGNVVASATDITAGSSASWQQYHVYE